MKQLKKLAAHFVTMYANRIFSQAIKTAELRYDEEKKMMFVITDPGNPKRLIVINTKEFLSLRHSYNIPSKALPIHKIKNTCWYHTKNVSGKDKMTDYDLNVRRLAFIRASLEKAKLI